MGVWFLFIVRDFGFLYYVLLADSKDRTADSSHTPPQPTPSLVSLTQSSLARGWLATRREPARAGIFSRITLQHPRAKRAVHCVHESGALVQPVGIAKRFRGRRPKGAADVFHERFCKRGLPQRARKPPTVKRFRRRAAARRRRPQRACRPRPSCCRDRRRRAPRQSRRARRGAAACSGRRRGSRRRCR